MSSENIVTDPSGNHIIMETLPVNVSVDDDPHLTPEFLDEIRNVLNISDTPPPSTMTREISHDIIIQQRAASQHPTHIRYTADEPSPMSESSTTTPSSDSSDTSGSTNTTIESSALVTPAVSVREEYLEPITPPRSPREASAPPPPPEIPRTRRRIFTPRNRRRASAQNEGTLSFTRQNIDSPLICISTATTPGTRFIWIPLKELGCHHFMKYRAQISAHLARIQSQARSCELLARQRLKGRLTQYIPAPDERKFLLMLFNNHLEPHEKRRYITEYSHTIIGSSTCIRCLNITYNKKKCLHFECPGMCEGCHKEIGETCPACQKEQKIICPICKDKKSEEELAPAPSGCGHYVCFKCLGKAYQSEHPIKKCPLCRKSWHN